MNPLLPGKLYWWADNNDCLQIPMYKSHNCEDGVTTEQLKPYEPFVVLEYHEFRYESTQCRNMKVLTTSGAVGWIRLNNYNTVVLAEEK